MRVDPLFLLSTAIFALLGLLLGLFLWHHPRIRENGWVQASAAAGVSAAAALVLSLSAPCSSQISAHRAGAEAFIFFAASLPYLPLLVYIGVFQFGRLIEHVTSPGRADDPRRKRTPSLKEEWNEIQVHLEALSRHPIDPHHRRRLAECYLRLGLIDSAIAELRKAISCTDRGYDHAYVIFKAAHLIADGKQDVPGALPLLRRLVRLYPKSYFAAYARRIINQHEAHHPRGPERRNPSAIGD